MSAGFFDVLGASTAAGRTFTEHEVETGQRLAVLSEGLWQRRFGGDPSVVGRTLVVDREVYTVIGVTARGFEPVFTAPSCGRR